MGNKKLEPRKFQNGGTFVKVIMKPKNQKVELIKKYFESKLPKDIRLGSDIPGGDEYMGDYKALLSDVINNLRDSGVVNDKEYYKLFDEYEGTDPYFFDNTEYYTDERVNEITNELVDHLRKYDSLEGNKLMPKKQDGGDFKEDYDYLFFLRKLQDEEGYTPARAIAQLGLHSQLPHSKSPKLYDWLFDKGINWGSHYNDNKYKLDKLIESYNYRKSQDDDWVVFPDKEERFYDTISRWNDEGRITDDEYNYAFDKIQPFLSDRKYNRLTPKKQDGGTLDQDRMDALTDAIKGKSEEDALDLISSWNDNGFINNEEYNYLFNYTVNSNGSARNAEVPTSGNSELVEPGESFDNEVNMEGNPSGESEEENGKYVVKKGDSLWKIAKDHGMTVAELRSLNPKFANSNLIHPDDVLNVGTHSYSEYQYSDFDKAYAKAYKAQQPTFEFNGKMYATPFKTAEQETPIQGEEENNEPEEQVNESDVFMNELNSIVGETKNDESRSETRRRNRERREKRRQDRKERREERRSERKDRESRILERSRNRR